MELQIDFGTLPLSSVQTTWIENNFSINMEKPEKCAKKGSNESNNSMLEASGGSITIATFLDK